MYKMSFGCSTSAKVNALSKKEDYYNYYLAQCPKGLTNVHGYEQLVYPEVYPGIDLHCSSNEAGLKYYFVVKAGADADLIKLKFTGASTTSVTPGEGLRIESSIGGLEFEKAHVYRINQGGNLTPMPASGAFVQTDTNEFGIVLQNYPPNSTVVIVMDVGHTLTQALLNGNLEWSTWVGGSNDDIAIDVTTDNSGVYVVGATVSNNFPYNPGTVTNVAQPNFGGYRDAFAAKFDNLAELEWTTYYGGGTSLYYADDAAIGVVHDDFGRICFTGYTWSSDFPTKPYGTHYFQDYLGGESDAFIVQLANDGSSLWATYFGGNTRDAAHSIVRSGGGEILICGSVASTLESWPYSSLIIGNNGCLPPSPVNSFNGGFVICNSNGTSYFHQTHSGGEFDGFITRFNAGGEITWSTLFGGGQRDAIRDIVLDQTDNSIYITGYTQSDVVGNNSISSPCDAPTDNGFPLCDLGGSSYYQDIYPGGYQNAFISKFNSQNQLLWSTFFGSTDDNFGSHLAVNSLGDLYLTGIAETYTSDDLPDNYCVVPTNGGFPLCDPGNSAYYRDNDGVDVGWEMYIARFNSSKQITWSTFYGGSGDDYNDVTFREDANAGIALDNNDNVYITGSSKKISGTGDLGNLPHSNYYDQPNNAGSGATRDAFIAVFNDLDQPIWRTYFGGGGSGVMASDVGSALVISNDEKLYLVGGTISTTFPTECPSAPNPYCQPNLNGNYDAFVARFNISDLANITDHYGMLNSNLSVYPNPTSGNITIDFVSSEESPLVIQIYSHLGQVLMNKELVAKPGDNAYSLSLNNFPNGFYIIRIDVNGSTFSSKIIKQD